MSDRSNAPCGDKPNCVSTQDNRDKHTLAPYSLKQGVTIEQVKTAALQLSGAKLASEKDQYLHIECTSKIMRFVDDLELKIEGEQLIVRSESRVGYSDFGVNRKRAEKLREILKDTGLLK